MNNTMKAYRVSEYEIWAGYDEISAKTDYLIETGEPVDPDFFSELTDEQLDELIPELDEDEQPTGNMTTLRSGLDELIEPGLLAVAGGV